MLKGICYINEGGKMYFEPKNRHLLVLPLDTQEEEKTRIVLPDDYKKPKSVYVNCKVIAISQDCSLNVELEDTIVVERRMIQEIKAGGETNYLVLENYVYGRLLDE
tara:strand:- start:387 stop:704 length:318 start_codon:yes stop_codon:yes gene_type:complete